MMTIYSMGFQLRSKQPFFLATLPRSGAHLLMSLLNSTGEVGHLEERLYPMRSTALTCTDAEVLSFFKKVHGLATKGRESPSGHWGTKVDIEDVPFVERCLGVGDISAQSIKWIWLRRKDKRKQAISLIKAFQTGIWRVDVDDDSDKQKLACSDIDVSDADLHQYSLLFYVLEDAWKAFFKENEIKPHVIYYEDFVEEVTWTSVVAGIFDFLGVPYTSIARVSTSLMKQSAERLPPSYERFDAWVNTSWHKRK